MSTHMTCTCGPLCGCYYRDRRISRQWFDGQFCVVEYETGETQRLKRDWLDLDPNRELFPVDNQSDDMG